ncbi:hypothetical protein HHI36_005826 [Cryptolaemus montrouzieri]|uniref:Uncharacterized protein n=1 Tax=Cryptolaemus montrouzieri TaxID=559131 RepID=A0ABD2NV82_9CUCU
MERLCHTEHNNPCCGTPKSIDPFWCFCSFCEALESALRRLDIGRDIKQFRPITQLRLLDFYNDVELIDLSFVSDENISVDFKFEKLIDFLENAFLKSFLEKTYTSRTDKPNKVKLFHDSLEHMRDMLSFLREICNQFDSPENRELYKSYKKRYQQAIRHKCKMYVGHN